MLRWSFPSQITCRFVTKHIFSVLPYLFFFNVWHWETISDFHNPIIIYAQKGAKHTRLSFISHHVMIEDAEHHNRMESTISSAIPWKMCLRLKRHKSKAYQYSKTKSRSSCTRTRTANRREKAETGSAQREKQPSSKKSLPRRGNKWLQIPRCPLVNRCVEVPAANNLSHIGQQRAKWCLMETTAAFILCKFELNCMAHEFFHR